MPDRQIRFLNFRIYLLIFETIYNLEEFSKKKEGHTLLLHIGGVYSNTEILLTCIKEAPKAPKNEFVQCHSHYLPHDNKIEVSVGFLGNS